MEFFNKPTHHAGGEAQLVELDPDHPGFRDQSYRGRRNVIAKMALQFQTGTQIPLADYSPEEHGVWRTVAQKLYPIHQEKVCVEILELQKIVALPLDVIPQLRDVSVHLQRSAGFRMEPVAGLISPRIFLRYLGRRVFLSTQYIRHHSRPWYTPEPDIIHELVGHAASLAHPGIAETNRLLGLACEVATEAEMRRLSRVYWYTLEFGVVQEAGHYKAFGAGLLSSIGELERFDTDATLMDWDLEQMAQTPYDPTDYQSHLFVAPSFTRMLAELCAWLRTGAWRDQRGASES
ncbi:MAG: phenylalanine 4-monooxygenase [Myxococcota bacterium]